MEGKVGKPGEHQRETLLFRFWGWYGWSSDKDLSIIRAPFQDNTAEDGKLFLFRDDLDAVLEALEADDIDDEYFEEAATEHENIWSKTYTAGYRLHKKVHIP